MSTPTVDPHTVRDGMLADYSSHIRKMGGEVVQSDVERIVQRDLASFEALEREKRKAPPPAPLVRDPSANVGHRLAAKSGATFYQSPIESAPVRRRTILDQLPQLVSPRWPYALGRIKRILEGANVGTPGARPKGIRAALANAQCPGLAERWLEAVVYYQSPYEAFPDRNGNPANPFYNKAESDLDRIFIRVVEDICDASIAKLGQWAIPK